jgi:hypothetical protein
MDINYFLLLKNKYNNILTNLETIIEDCDDIRCYTDEYVSSNNKSLYMVFNPHLTKAKFIENKKYVEQLKNTCIQCINSNCNHEFIEDVIDISPDRSKTIRYCRFCEESENNE